MKKQNMHGTGLVLDGVGVLLRGRSGAGKSLLALELLDVFELRGKKALLVSDDRVDITVGKSGVVMIAPKEIAGLIELRGWGIVSRPHIAMAKIELVVDLVEDMERFLEEDALETEIEGVKLPRCPVPERGKIDSAHQKLLVLEALRGVHGKDKK